MTLPTIPPLPAQATWDQQMRHLEAQMAALRFTQAERNTEAQNRLAAAQERIADALPQQLALMQQLLDAPAAPAASSGNGLTAGDVAIVKGIVEAVRPVQG